MTSNETRKSYSHHKVARRTSRSPREPARNIGEQKIHETPHSARATSASTSHTDPIRMASTHSDEDIVERLKDMVGTVDTDGKHRTRWSQAKRAAGLGKILCEVLKQRSEPIKVALMTQDNRTESAGKGEIKMKVYGRGEISLSGSVVFNDMIKIIEGLVEVAEQASEKMNKSDNAEARKVAEKFIAIHQGAETQYYDAIFSDKTFKEIYLGRLKLIFKRFPVPQGQGEIELPTTMKGFHRRVAKQDFIALCNGLKRNVKFESGDDLGKVILTFVDEALRPENMTTALAQKVFGFLVNHFPKVASKPEEEKAINKDYYYAYTADTKPLFDYVRRVAGSMIEDFGGKQGIPVKKIHHIVGKGLEEEKQKPMPETFVPRAVCLVAILEM